MLTAGPAASKPFVTATPTGAAHTDHLDNAGGVKSCPYKQQDRSHRDVDQCIEIEHPDTPRDVGPLRSEPPKQHELHHSSQDEEQTDTLDEGQQGTVLSRHANVEWIPDDAAGSSRMLTLLSANRLAWRGGVGGPVTQAKHQHRRAAAPVMTTVVQRRFTAGSGGREGQLQRFAGRGA